MSEPLQITLQLDNIHCYDEADGPGDAEPYLWVVFFKIDGDTVTLDEKYMLSGSATVTTRAGNHRDLGTSGVGAGANVAIPPQLGSYGTLLKPIPLSRPLQDIQELPGVAGCVAILIEQDGTPDDAIVAGHTALNQAIRDQINQLIPTLGATNPEISSRNIDDITQYVQDKAISAITRAITSNFRNFLNPGVLDKDDIIGHAVFLASQDQLAKAGTTPTLFQAWWIERGAQLFGTGSPPTSVGRFEPGRYDQRAYIGSLTLPRGWRLTTYPNPGFGGAPRIIEQSQVADIEAGSFEVDMGRVVLFDQPAYRGRQVVFDAPGRYDYNQLGAVGNDRAASVRVPDGWRVTAYSEAGYWGDAVTYTANAAISGVLANRLSSLVIERADAVSGDGDWELRGRAFVVPKPPPLPHYMNVSFLVLPKPDIASSVTVVVRDSVTGQPVSGRVVINGNDTAATNTPFTFTFRTRTETRVVWLPPDDNSRGPRRVTVKVHVWLDQVVVQASGFPDASLPFPSAGDDL